MLVQASRSVGPAILDHAGVCLESSTNADRLKPLLAYTDEAFPHAQASLTVEGHRGIQSLLRSNQSQVEHPDWLPETGFAGLVVDRGEIEIRNVLMQQKIECRVTAIFTLPLGSNLAQRLSTVSGMAVTAVTPKPFRVHSPNRRVFRTIEGNFFPGVSRPAAVVLTVRNWETGAPEDWVAYTVQPSYAETVDDVARLGSQVANWVWPLAAVSLSVLLLNASGVWLCAGSFLRMTRIRPGRADQVQERRVLRIFLALRIYQQLCGATGAMRAPSAPATSDQPGVKES